MKNRIGGYCHAPLLLSQGKIFFFFGHFVRRITLLRFAVNFCSFSFLTLSADSFRPPLFLSSSSLLVSSLFFFLFKLNCNMFVFSPNVSHDAFCAVFSIPFDVKATKCSILLQRVSKFNKVQFTPCDVSFAHTFTCQPHLFRGN